jgi:DNA-binding CsgD family transcriptional regulator
MAAVAGAPTRITSRSAWILVAALTVIGGMLVVDLVAPRDITTGGLVLVVAVTAALLLGDLLAVMVLLAAVGSRIAAAAFGDISVGQAAIEVVSLVLASGAAAATRPMVSETVRGAVHPEPAALPATPAVAAPATLSTEAALRIDNGGLTAREREVLHMAMQGLTAAQVAERLFISKRTVETHLERAYNKLGVRSKRQLIASAFDEARSTQP